MIDARSLPRRLCRIGLLVYCVIGLCLPAIAQPTAQFANPESSRATVVVDGRSQFSVGGIEGFTAEERAAQANQVIREVLRTRPEAASVRVLERGGFVTLRLNRRHLLTVTESDVVPGETPEERAEAWEDMIEPALVRSLVERTPAYLRQAATRFGLFVVIALLLHGISLLLVNQILTRHSRSPSRQSPVLQRRRSRLVLVGLLGRLLLWLAVVIYGASLFPLTRQWRFQIWQLLKTSLWFPVFRLADQPYSLADLLILIGLILTLWLGVRAVVQGFKARVLGLTGVPRGTQEVIATLTQYSLTVVGSIGLLQAWGIDISSLTIIASVLGVGIGFGLQDLANNFVSGVVLLLERPVQAGDFIDLDGLFGTVEHVGPRSTQIRRLDQVAIFIPNAELLNKQLVNWSYGQRVVRVTIPIRVTFEADLDQVRQVLIDIAKHHKSVLSIPQPLVIFTELGESALHLMMIVATRDPKDQFLLKSDLQYLIVKRFQRYGIRIPHQQQDIHVRSPQLGPLVEQWTAGQGSSEAGPATLRLYDARGRNLKTPLNGSTSVEESLVVPQRLEESLTAIDVDALTAEMRGEDGVEIKDRVYRLRLYERSFLGCEAVDWLMRTQGVSDQGALDIGQMLMDRGVIRHVADEQLFQDAYYFYRFYGDEQP
ncbi:MAG: mechanosensitive ion channel domain-containing protein [Elainellaceae cyanobacterium]